MDLQSAARPPQITIKRFLYKNNVVCVFTFKSFVLCIFALRDSAFLDLDNADYTKR